MFYGILLISTLFNNFHVHEYEGSNLLECDAMLCGSYVRKARDALCFKGQGFKNLGEAMFLSRGLEC
jgi:hypothetical protein